MYCAKDYEGCPWGVHSELTMKVTSSLFIASCLDLWTFTFWLKQVGFSIGPTKSQTFSEGFLSAFLDLGLCLAHPLRK